MSSVGSLNSQSVYGGHTRYTGLASGLDVDEIVKGMTYSTTSKINSKYQQKQKLQWKMDSYRSISSKLVEFSRKYTSMSSSTNLYSSSFYAKNKITALGDNSKYISVSGSSPSVETLSVAAVKQLAQDSSYVSSSNVSDGKLSTGEFDLAGQVDISNLAGQTLRLTYGGSTYSVTLNSRLEYDTPEKAIESFNECLKQVNIGNNQTLADKVQASLSNNNYFQLSFTDSTDSNTLKVAGGTETLLKTLGLEVKDQFDPESGYLRGVNRLTEENIITSKDFSEVVGGKSMTFNYNGVTKTIKFPKLEDYTNADGDADIDLFVDNIQKQLNENFGTGRIKVGKETTADGKFKLTMETTTPSGGVDNSSILKITTADDNVTGLNGAFKMEFGESNRINLNGSVKNSGLKGNSTSLDAMIADAKANNGGKDPNYAVVINGVTIDKTVDGIAFDENTSVNDIIKAINSNKEAKVKVTYLETSDKFSVVSTENGASGKIEFGETGNDTVDLGKHIFGYDSKNTINADVKNGQDAEIYVKYGGDSDYTLLTRSSNTFNLDGLKVTVNDEFGMKADGTGPTEVVTDAVTFNAKADVDKIVDAVKEMIKDYNEIIETCNTEVNTKYDRDYPPLTNEQKEQMSDSEIETWEKKAKEGLLFNDADLRGFTDGIRPIFSSNSDLIQQLKDIGITTSSTRSDNGKLVLDENALRSALEERPEDIERLFTAEMETKLDSNGKEVKNTSTGGVMTKIKNIFDVYAATEGTTKGIFIEKAGSPYSPLSLLSNTIQKEMDDIDKQVKTLQKKLQVEENRYYNQFTRLETLTQQMNSQSSYFASMMGGGGN